MSQSTDQPLSDQLIPTPTGITPIGVAYATTTRRLYSKRCPYVLFDGPPNYGRNNPARLMQQMFVDAGYETDDESFDRAAEWLDNTCPKSDTYCFTDRPNPTNGETAMQMHQSPLTRLINRITPKSDRPKHGGLVPTKPGLEELFAKAARHREAQRALNAPLVEEFLTRFPAGSSFQFAGTQFTVIAFDDDEDTLILVYTNDKEGFTRVNVGTNYMRAILAATAPKVPATRAKKVSAPKGSTSGGAVGATATFTTTTGMEEL